MKANPQNLKETNAEKEKISFFRQQLKSAYAALKADFTKNPNTAKLFKQHYRLVDGILTKLWSQSHIHRNACLIAVGGYGRGELYPQSDIDLLILLPDHLADSAAINSQLEAFIGMLWDIGLTVGHRVRNLSECIAEAAKDITVQTNLMESRLLTGDTRLYQTFIHDTHHALDIQAFFTAKLKEQEKRHAKFNDTAYNLEPNIKESPGGLRDLHLIIWLMRSLAIHQQINTSAPSPWAALIKQNIITALEAKQIRLHEKNLQRLRIHLHFLSGRREDRLLFDFQNDLAATLRYITTPRKRASEQLMQSYYRSVKFVRSINEILVKLLQQKIALTPATIWPINAHFEAHNQLLATKHPDLFETHPSAILEAFLILQQHPELTGMSAPLLRNLQRAKHLLHREFRNNSQHKQLFIHILSQASGVNHALRAMNRYGILGCYIPAFGKIIGQMQHDLFHVYTVDEHILNVLANLRRFAKSELKHEFPLCSRLFSAFDAPHLLYLAALFHDIAKGRGGDHSSLGAIDATKFCQSHGLAKADCALVAWLVSAHLQMSSTAQKSDLSDPSVIETFANFVGNERRLTALYLLTVADIRGTSPAVWNAWKARLLESLFHATQHALSNKTLYSAQQAIHTRKQDAAQKLGRFGLSKNAYEPLWDKFGPNYFIRHESDEIAWHSRLLTPHLNTEKAIVRARLSPNGDGIQVMIYTKDQSDLFSRICNFFDRMGCNIAEAKIYTTDHHYALDSFIILDQSGKSVSYSGLLKHIEVELTNKLEEKQALESPLQGRSSRQVKHMPIPTQITMTEEADNQHKLEIIANDRPGLLAMLAQQFLLQNIELHNAKVNTLGNRAEDIFLISAKKGQKLDSAHLENLYQALITEV